MSSGIWPVVGGGGTPGGVTGNVQVNGGSGTLAGNNGFTYNLVTGAAYIGTNSNPGTGVNIAPLNYGTGSLYLYAGNSGTYWGINGDGSGTLAGSAISWDTGGDFFANNLTGNGVSGGSIFGGSLFISGSTTLDDGQISNPGDGSGGWTVGSLRVNGGYISDSSNQPSIDPTDRFLFNPSGITVMYWDSTSVGFDNGAAYFDGSGNLRVTALTDGSTVAVDPLNRLLKDASANKSVDWTGRVLYDSSLSPQFSWTTAGVQINKTITSYNGRTTQGEGVPVIEGSKTLNGQNATIASTALVSSALNRQYQIAGNLIITTAGTGGTVSAQVQYTDNSNTARTINLASINLNALGAESTADVTIWPKGSTAINYTSTVTGATGSPLYGIALSAVVK